MKDNKDEFNTTFNRFYWVYLIGFFLILALPLFAVPPLLHPPAWGKTIFFRTILAVMIFFFLWQLLSKKFVDSHLIRRFASVSLLFWLLIALLGFMLLSTIFSPERHFSFWGNPYRAGGFLNFSFYIIFAILAFLILRPKDWQKIWNFSFLIAILVSLIAIFQQFKTFGGILVPYEKRPPSTMGAPIFLALYLLLLIFLTLSFGIRKRNFKKRFFYFFVFLLFLLVIFLAGTRAVYLGLGVGMLFFLFFYPKKIVWLKVLAGIFLIVAIFGIYYLNTHIKEIFNHPYILAHQNLASLLERFIIRLFLEDPRFIFWKIVWQPLMEKPIFGWGPENFSIAYDKYYDPSLPYISYEAGSQVDRAHGFIFDTAITAGIPALIIYLFLFFILFWKLRRIKNTEQPKHTELDKNEQRNTQILVHGIQATFIAYLVADFFCFDTFDTYFVSFLLVGYALSLISENTLSTLHQPRNIQNRTPKNTNLWQSVFLFGLFCVLLGFIWFYNLKPLLINKDGNLAEFYSQRGNCQKAIDTMEKALPKRSIVDHYLRLQYLNVIKDCFKLHPEQKTELAQKAIEILDKTIELRPTYTRTWMFLGNYINLFVEGNEKLTPKERNELLERGDFAFRKALELSPKRQEVFLGWTNNNLISGKYDKALEKANQCIEIDPEFGPCWWQRALANISLGNLTEASEDIKKANQKGFNINTKTSISQLLKVYSILIKNTPETKIEYYQPLVDIHQKLISFEPKNFQYHASLAYVYKVLGEYEKARQEAQIVMELSPESRQSVEEFLQTLR